MRRVDLSSFGVLLLVILAVVALVVVLFNQPQSTPGIPIVAYNTARIEPGKTLVIRQPAGKTSRYWYITYDGDKTVKFDCRSLCPDETITLCGIGCEVTVSAGLFRVPFKVNSNSPGTVDIIWPNDLSTMMSIGDAVRASLEMLKQNLLPND